MISDNPLVLDKLSLIITTRCNLKCKLCCEYVPQNKSFPDMTPEEANRILTAAFEVISHVHTLHLTGGGEPFLHPRLAELIDLALRWSDRFDRLMLFTNSTIPINSELLQAIKACGDKVLVQLSQYGLFPERERAAVKLLRENGVACKVEKYYGAEQSFGGWVDFGSWEPRGRTPAQLTEIFSNCAVTRNMHGNWRTRDGKVHWCSRSQRGMELGLISECPEEYVDLFDSSSTAEKRDKFRRLMATKWLSVCDCCSGDQGTNDVSKRYSAAEQST